MDWPIFLSGMMVGVAVLYLAIDSMFQVREAPPRRWYQRILDRVRAS